MYLQKGKEVTIIKTQLLPDSSGSQYTQVGTWYSYRGRRLYTIRYTHTYALESSNIRIANTDYVKQR